MIHFLVWFPLLAAGLMQAASSRDTRSAWRLASVLATLPLIVATVLLVQGGAVSSPVSWFTLPGSGAVVHYALSAQGLGLWLAWLASLLTLLALFAARMAFAMSYREFAVCMLSLETTLMGAFLANDAVLFFLFFEAMILPASVLIAVAGGAYRRDAAMLFAIYTLLGSTPMLFGLWYLIALCGSSAPADLALAASGLDAHTQGVLFFVFALAFAVKTPLFPLHGWQAKTYAEAPAPLTAVLSGAMAKVGLFGFAAWVIPIFPEASRQYGPALVTLGLVTLIYGALVALRENDARKLLAFSSLSHLGLATAGLFTLSGSAFVGVAVLLVGHGLSAGALFLLTGMAERWTGSRSLLGFGALASSNPLFAVLFGFAGVAAVAVPGTAGFVGEFLILQGVWETYGFWPAVVGGLGMILGAAYTLRLIRAFLFGKAEASCHTAALAPTDALAVAPLVILLIVFGLHPAPIIHTVDGNQQDPPAAQVAR
jgi:NADH-quinone oxidoreductase subunit M